MKKLIRVTAKDIKNGSPEDFENCPIALALTRCLKKPCTARLYNLDDGPAFYNIENISYRRFLPKKCFNFIHKFDAGKKVKPFNFTINID